MLPPEQVTTGTTQTRACRENLLLHSLPKTADQGGFVPLADRCLRCLQLGIMLQDWLQML